MPFLPGVSELATGGIIPGGTNDNYHYTMGSVNYGDKVSQIKRLMLNDAQTSGGLLISCKEKEADKILDGMKDKKILGVLIGRITEKKEVYIKVK